MSSFRISIGFYYFLCKLIVVLLTGDDGKMENENPGLLKDSENLYTLWCSGRTCCEGMLVELKFLKVHPIFSVCFNQPNFSIHIL